MKKAPSIMRLAVLPLCFLSLAACTNMTDTEQRTLSGGAAGAIVGTGVTVITGGCIPCGAAIGGAVGAGTGYIIDQVDKNNKAQTSSSGSQSSSPSGSSSQ